MAEYSRIQAADGGDASISPNRRAAAKNTALFQAGLEQRYEELEGTSSNSWSARLKLVLDASSISRGRYFVKWALPGFGFAFAFTIQNIFLHVATYFYVQWMLRLEASLEQHQNITHSRVQEAFSSSVGAGSLHDVGALVFGFHEIPTRLLDGISLLVPFIWLISVVYKLDLQLFSKACLCGGLLAITKGVFAVCTVVPDSTGWDGCKARLGQTGVAWFSDADNMNFAKRGIVDSMTELLRVEIMGTKDVVTGATTRFRFCADMVYSGHTYFAALFATALYDFVSKHWFERSLSDHPWRRISLLLVGALLAAYVIADCTLILLNRFHYTLDIVLALVIVYLFYTNTPVARIAQWWANEVWVPRSRHRQLYLLSKSGLSGDVMVPPCCIWPPFCCMSGRYEVARENRDALDYSQNLIMGFLRDNPDRFVATLQAALDCQEARRTFPTHVLAETRRFCENGHVVINVAKNSKTLEDGSLSLDWIEFMEKLDMGYDKAFGSCAEPSYSKCLCVDPVQSRVLSRDKR